MIAATLQLDDINLTSQIACSSRLDSAFNWLFKSRQNADSNDLFWGMARHWKRIKATLRETLQRGDYTFKPLKTVQLQDGMLVSLWHPLDAIVIKALMIY